MSTSWPIIRLDRWNMKVKMAISKTAKAVINSNKYNKQVYIVLLICREKSQSTSQKMAWSKWIFCFKICQSVIKHKCTFLAFEPLFETFCKMTHTAAVHLLRNYRNIPKQKHKWDQKQGQSQSKPLNLLLKSSKADSVWVWFQSHTEIPAHSVLHHCPIGCGSRVHESPLVSFCLPQREEEKKKHFMISQLFSSSFSGKCIQSKQSANNSCNIQS